jgi:metal-responsive CopG/Arc/MetJ family transcriptional regulator
VKTAVSIPDPLFQAAERLARRRGVARSQLYAEALERLVGEKTSAEDRTAQVNRVVAELETASDHVTREAARRSLARAEW